MKNQYKIFSIVLLCLLIASAGCKKDQETLTENTLVFGVLFPLDVASGDSYIAPVKTSIEEINMTSKLLGNYEIVLDIRTTEPIGLNNRATNAAVAALDILNDHPNNLIGFITAWSASSRGITLQVGEPYKIPVISGNSTADANTGLSEYFHRISAPDKYQTNILARKAIEYNIQTVAIAVQKGDVYSEGLAEKFIENYTTEGGVITKSVFFIENDPDYFYKLNELYEGNPDAVLTATVSIDVQLLNAINDNAGALGLDVDELRFIFTDTQKHDNLLEQAPDILFTGLVNEYPKAFGTVLFPDRTTTSYKYFETLYENKYNEEVQAFGAQFYDVVKIYALAIERAAQDGYQVTDIERFREGVNKNIRMISRNDSGEIQIKPEDGWPAMQTLVINGDVNYEGASSNCDIDEFGDILMNYDIYVVEIDNEGNAYFRVIENVSP